MEIKKVTQEDWDLFGGEYMYIKMRKPARYPKRFADNVYGLEEHVITSKEIDEGVNRMLRGRQIERRVCGL